MLGDVLIGYDISGYDNDSYMCGSCDKLFPELTDIPKCPKCGYRTDYRYTNKDFKLKRKTMDFSSTYDGVTIVSRRFKDFCVRNEYDNLVFVELPKSPFFYQFYINGNVLEYDAGEKHKYCKTCGQYESVVVPIIKLDRITGPLKDGFYQSDLWFASGNEKHPLTVISPETKLKLESEKIKNICMREIIKRGYDNLAK